MVLAAVFMVCATTLGVVRMLTARPKPPEAPPAPVERTESTPAPSVLDERLLDAVIVTLKTGRTFAGVLYAEDSGAVVLCKAEVVDRDNSRTPADGEIIVLRDDIDFIQRP